MKMWQTNFKKYGSSFGWKDCSQKTFHAFFFPSLFNNYSFCTMENNDKVLLMFDCRLGLTSRNLFTEILDAPILGISLTISALLRVIYEDMDRRSRTVCFIRFVLQYWINFELQSWNFAAWCHKCQNGLFPSLVRSYLL